LVAAGQVEAVLEHRVLDDGVCGEQSSMSNMMLADVKQMGSSALRAGSWGSPNGRRFSEPSTEALYLSGEAWRYLQVTDGAEVVQRSTYCLRWIKGLLI